MTTTNLIHHALVARLPFRRRCVTWQPVHDKLGRYVRLGFMRKGPALEDCSVRIEEIENVEAGGDGRPVCFRLYGFGVRYQAWAAYENNVRGTLHHQLRLSDDGRFHFVEIARPNPDDARYMDILAADDRDNVTVGPGDFRLTVSFASESGPITNERRQFLLQWWSEPMAMIAAELPNDLVKPWSRRAPIAFHEWEEG